MGREAGAINHGVEGPEPSRDASVSRAPARDERKVIFRPAGRAAAEFRAGERVGGFSHSVFFKCSDTSHLQPPPVSRRAKHGSALFKSPTWLLQQLLLLL